MLPEPGSPLAVRNFCLRPQQGLAGLARILQRAGDGSRGGAVRGVHLRREVVDRSDVHDVVLFGSPRSARS
jgi:hypothetical protein